jgi:hypothetical protein
MMLGHRNGRIDSPPDVYPLPAATLRIRPDGSAHISDTGAAIRHNRLMRDDDIIRRIERHRFPRAPVAAMRRNRGYTLLHTDTGAPIARLRPIGPDDQMEILYWSAWKQHWAPTGPSAAPLCPSTRLSTSSPTKPSSGPAYSKTRPENAQSRA